MVCAGTAGAGVFRSTDQGATWVQVLPDLDVQALATDPGGGQVVLAGTGDGGLWRSTDEGGTWAVVLPEVGVQALAIAPLNPDWAYAATQSHGVYRSTDGGVTWRQKAGWTANAVAVDPSNPQVVYLGTYSESSLWQYFESYLQRSDDFIRFCCHLHITEMLAARGGAGKTRVVWRWPIGRQWTALGRANYSWLKERVDPATGVALITIVWDDSKGEEDLLTFDMRTRL